MAFAMALPPTIPIAIIPAIIPSARGALPLTPNFSNIANAVPAPTLHRKMFAKYWYAPSLILLGNSFFQLSFANKSPKIPPEIPPITGTKPRKESLLISEKISLDVIFSGSGIKLSRKVLSTLGFLCRSLTSLKFNSLFFALLSICDVFESRLFFC